SKVDPIIVLTKTDLAPEGRIEEITGQVRRRISDIPVVAISNQTQDGYAGLNQLIEKGKTYCLLGSSGVGKSTLLNNLSGRPVMRTDAISASSGKGRHVTSHRELIVLENGGILIDNPGMREVGIADEGGGLESTFNRIVSLAGACRYADCTHTSEAGCAVLEALGTGGLDRGSYENYLKMERERAHYESTTAERKRKDRQFGKILKDYQIIDPKKRK
ncbi:MAG: ribosome small subunit-dependent GTPase A, partial [Bacteroidales bacterium]